MASSGMFRWPVVAGQLLQSSIGKAMSDGRNFGVSTALASTGGVAYFSMVICPEDAQDLTGLGAQGAVHGAVAALVAQPDIRVLEHLQPPLDLSISFRGKGCWSGVRLHTTEQVSH